ncbi:16616_t:CDS:1, partial [Gigaspora margarita]
DPNIVKLVFTTTHPLRKGEKIISLLAKKTFQAELEKSQFLEYDGNYYRVHTKVVDLILETQNNRQVVS